MNVKPSMRLKVKKGTFFMPEPDGSVYFRNNAGSFRMEGKAIHQWVEKLLPMLNGEHSLADLTEGLSHPYHARVYEITDVLYNNGFLRDMSADHPHELHPQVAEKFASQIEFLESFGDSASFRFQKYRRQKVIAAGEGNMLLGAVSALLASGLPGCHVILTDENESSRRRVRELEAWARETDPEVRLTIALENPFSWEQEIEPYDAVFYASHQDYYEERTSLLTACQKKHKWFIPILCSRTEGFAGPAEIPGPDSRFESAWRSLPRKEADEEQSGFISSPAAAMLTNVAVFEWFKKMTGVPDVHPSNHMFVLTDETLEGKWHPFKPHPLVTGHIVAERVEDVLEKTKDQEADPEKEWFFYFNELASGPLGIFQRYEEGDLPQLPLSQCEVQVADLHSGHPHPGRICAAMTHEEARREAGLAGMEQYLSPLKKDILNSLDSVNDRSASLYLGAGETGTRTAISRALTNLLEERLQETGVEWTPAKLELNRMEDDQCRFYYQALQTLKKEVELGLGEDAYGFPVVWTKAGKQKWYGSVGFTRTLALRQALRRALMEEQNPDRTFVPDACIAKVNDKEGVVHSLDIPSCQSDDPEVLSSAIQQLKRSHQDLFFIKVTMDPFKDDAIMDLFGVVVREEETG
ncbi:bacteriocin maturation protein [Halobacillus halophilus]|uniref:bacteriocin maturation protein n=1 Tax=Halobacillus halophilus TaxID=1570 RepID=UPI001CD6588F|nr:bacteriocin maturation protein [Halobacillus halophilus]MCA1011530.1 bacteriocin maturation protein [Halobacillus halophilus]